jgi:hypothetical protein
MKILIALFCTATAAFAGTVTLTMAEVAQQGIDGLTVSSGGVSFTFTDAGKNLFYNANGPGNRTYVQDPSIVGTPDVFSIAFSVPAATVQFGMAFGQADSASVDLFYAGGGSTTAAFTTTLIDPFREGQFIWSGAPVSSITITPSVRTGILAFDNLTVSTSSISSPSVPEPSTVSFLALGAVAMLARKFRRRS